jgi:hypothetical protein
MLTYILLSLAGGMFADAHPKIFYTAIAIFLFVFVCFVVSIFN